MFQPKVSVMIPTYNQAKYIYNTVISVINQDYDNLEIVISDDASTDNTEAVVRKIINETPERDIKYIKRTENIGNIANYHDTLQNIITGDYVLNLLNKKTTWKSKLFYKIKLIQQVPFEHCHHDG